LSQVDVAISARAGVTMKRRTAAVKDRCGVARKGWKRLGLVS
jgi:hypothetical protein